MTVVHTETSTQRLHKEAGLFEFTKPTSRRRYSSCCSTERVGTGTPTSNFAFFYISIFFFLFQPHVRPCRLFKYNSKAKRQHTRKKERKKDRKTKNKKIQNMKRRNSAALNYMTGSVSGQETVTVVFAPVGATTMTTCWKRLVLSLVQGYIK